MKIERLFEITQSQALDINTLRGLLTPGAKTLPHIRIQTLLSQPNLCFLAVLDDTKKIHGMGSLISYECPMGFRGVVEDVVILNELNGQGWGKKLTQSLIDAAKAEKIESIQLTSSPSREAANAVYASLGFEKRETNCYTMKLGKK